MVATEGGVWASSICLPQSYIRVAGYLAAGPVPRAGTCSWPPKPLLQLPSPALYQARQTLVPNRVAAADILCHQVTLMTKCSISGVVPGGDREKRKKKTLSSP